MDDAEAERELAEIRRRIEEEKQQLAELARQAEYAPLGQSLHALTAASPDTAPPDTTEETADTNENAA